MGMGGHGRTRAAIWAWALVMVGCGGAETVPDEPQALVESPPEQSVAAPAPPAPAPGSDIVVVAPVKPDGEQSSEPRPVAPIFQPGYHAALRDSYKTTTMTNGVLTVRLRVPMGRPGTRVRLTFQSAKDGALTLTRATVAKAGASGALASAPVPVTFKGAAGFTVGSDTLVTSDAVTFPVAFRDELDISFEVQGVLAASRIGTLPGSYMLAGSYATKSTALGGTASSLGVGLATVDVEGAPARAFVAIGDSITEGYISGADDTRKAWPWLTTTQLGVPVVNSGVSGQGVYEELDRLDKEVLPLQGLTDCIVLLGTNDLGSDKLTLDGLKARVSVLTNNLQSRCRTWVSTLLPKERTTTGNYETVKQERVAFNAWVRSTYAATLIDLEAATCQPNNVHLYRSGLTVDGIHPSAQGHVVIAAEVARVLRGAGVKAAADAEPLPDETSPSASSTSGTTSGTSAP